MKQTAVEWFFNELQRMQYFIGNDMLEAYKQAKEMEKVKQLKKNKLYQEVQTYDINTKRKSKRII